jgi:hypothetical protein
MEINTSTILNILKKGKMYFLIIFLLTLVISITIAFLLPVLYASTAQFFALNPKSYDPRTKFHYLEIYGTAEDVNRNVATAESGLIRDYIIKKYDLAKRYEYDTNDASQAAEMRMEYTSNLVVKETNKGAISITFYDKNADTAALIVNDIINQINVVNKSIIIDAINKQFITYKKVMEEKYNGLDSLSEILNRIKTEGRNSPGSDVTNMEMYQTFLRLKETEVNLEAIRDDIQTVLVIEKAIPVWQRAKPKRLFMVATACAATFIITLLFLLVKDRKEFEA